MTANSKPPHETKVLQPSRVAESQEGAALLSHLPAWPPAPPIRNSSSDHLLHPGHDRGMNFHVLGIELGLHAFDVILKRITFFKFLTRIVLSTLTVPM